MLPQPIVDIILARLALLFLAAAANEQAALQAASQMLAAYHPETEDELRLAANIISFSFHALEALAQAATPDMPLTKILRLRGSAVSLHREAAKAQSQLDQIQKARREHQPEPARSGPDQTPPKAEKAIDLVQETRSIAAAAQTGKLTWTQAYQQRQREKRLAQRETSPNHTPPTLAVNP